MVPRPGCPPTPGSEPKGRETASPSIRSLFESDPWGSVFPPAPATHHGNIKSRSANDQEAPGPSGDVFLPGIPPKRRPQPYTIPPISRPPAVISSQMQLSPKQSPLLQLTKQNDSPEGIPARYSAPRDVPVPARPDLFASTIYTDIDRRAEAHSQDMPRQLSQRRFTDPAALKGFTSVTERIPRSFSAQDILDTPINMRLPRTSSPISDHATLPAKPTDKLSVSPALKESRGKTTRRFECEQCGKRFSRPSSVRIHMHTHTGEKPFKCPEPNCGRAFSVHSNLRRHQKSHAPYTHTRTGNSSSP